MQKKKDDSPPNYLQGSLEILIMIQVWFRVSWIDRKKKTKVNIFLRMTSDIQVCKNYIKYMLSFYQVHLLLLALQQKSVHCLNSPSSTDMELQRFGSPVGLSVLACN